MVVVVVALLFVVSMAVVLGLALFVGWLLTLIFHFRLWAGTVLGLLTLATAGYLWSAVIRGLRPVASTEDEDDEEDEEDDEEPVPTWLPPLRILRGPLRGVDGELTWATWFTHLLAERVRQQIEEAPVQSRPMSDVEAREFALRSAVAGVRLLEAKSPQTKQLRVTRPALRRQMMVSGRPPAEDRLLDLAAEAINAALEVHRDELMRVIRDQSWAEAASIPR